jgi:putative hydrolase of the HAD superfamily
VAALLDVQVFSVEVGICKPDPEIYLTACRRLGVEPRECVYVGDGGSRELTGAAAVGMTPVRLDAPDLAHHLVFDRDDDFLGPAVSSLTELLTFINRSPALV